MEEISKTESKLFNMLLIMFTAFTGIFFAMSVFQFIEVGSLDNWFWVTRIALVVSGSLFVVFSLVSYKNLKNISQGN